MNNFNQLEKIEHIMNVFCKRILPAYLFQYEPGKFLKWQGNMCKQAAILGTFIIDNFMPDDYVRVEAWEGFFEHSKLGNYNHCWNYIIHKDDPKKNIICDFTSTITYMNYCDQNDPTLHITSNDNAVVKHNDNVTLVGIQQLDIETEFNGPEFYTNLSGKEIKMEIMGLLQHAKLWE